MISLRRICSFKELKGQYEKILDIKNALEGKANNLLTISGTVVTLLFQFGYFFVDKIGIHYPYLIHTTIPLPPNANSQKK